MVEYDSSELPDDGEAVKIMDVMQLTVRPLCGHAHLPRDSQATAALTAA